MRPVTTATGIMLLYTIIFVAGDPNTRTAYTICNRQVYRDEDLYQVSINDVLYHLQNKTVFNGHDYYYSSPWPGPTPICYGHSACNGQITHDDCSKCMAVALQQITDQCPEVIGAQIQLVDCRARYEQYESTSNTSSTNRSVARVCLGMSALHVQIPWVE